MLRNFFGLPCLQIVDFLRCDESFPESEKQMLFIHTSLFASVYEASHAHANTLVRHDFPLVAPDSLTNA